MTLVPRNWARTCFLWLSLAVVLICAIGSFGSPVRASSGSAFNAFTSDVSLGPSRAAPPEKDRKEQLPSGGDGEAKLVLLTAAILAPPPRIAAARHSGLLQASPPVATAGAVGARAPPLS